jgi:hypothetical protein
VNKEDEELYNAFWEDHQRNLYGFLRWMGLGINDAEGNSQRLFRSGLEVLT